MRPSVLAVLAPCACLMPVKVRRTASLISAGCEKLSAGN